MNSAQRTPTSSASAFARKTRRPVRQPTAETNLFISLIAFGLTVVVTRVFLQLAGYPQVGNSVLHIAHAIWGGLLLFVAVLIPLILANRWAYTISALLSGVGVGLFIDEVGKFITQKNDYFFAPAAPLIYSLFLLMTLLFLLLRRRRHVDPRASTYWALLGLREVLDNDLDPREREQMLDHLAIGRGSDEPHVALLAERLASYLQHESVPLIPYRPGFWVTLGQRVRAFGAKVGRANHRRLIIALLALSSLGTLGLTLLLVISWASPDLARVIVPPLLLSGTELSIQGPIWTVVRLVLELVVGLLYIVALLMLLRHREEGAITTAVVASLLSLTAVHLLNFYLNQFRSLLALFWTLAFLLVLLAYRAWYLPNGRR